MAFRAVNPFRVPLVIILGATGTGKTKLSLELAQKFGTEIISADSMQVYKGLDVVTAKATPQERSTVPHHLLDLLEPHQMFTVVDFRNRALKIIENLEEQGKIPVVVGGTNYYMESIVYNILVQEDDDTKSLLWDRTRGKRNLDDSEKQTDDETCKKKIKVDTSNNPECNAKAIKSEPNDTEVDTEKLKEDFANEKNFTNEEIHQKLHEIDPDMANRLHSNNRRKVLRSIEVFLRTGRQHSVILEEQRESEGILRRPGRTVILWLTCEQSVLNARLDARIDKMLEEGLVEELLDFHHRHNKQRIQDGEPPDYTKGVFQTLGLKEFHDYLMLTEEERNSEDGKAKLQQSIENMKIRTKSFSRRQRKMVRGRFMTHPRRQVPPIYELDTTILSKWDEEVNSKAIKIIESYLNGTTCEYQPMTTKKDEIKIYNTVARNFCETCKRIIIGEKSYKEHLESNRHKVALERALQSVEEDGKLPKSMRPKPKGRRKRNQ